MISKNKISEIRKLHQKKFRDLERLFLVEGRKSVKMLLDSSYTTLEIYATEEALSRNSAWLPAGITTMVSPREMGSISALRTPPEILAVARQADCQIPLPQDKPLIVLDHIADPGNLGTIVRTADWLDFGHIVCTNDCVELYNPKTIQATMGSFAHVNVQYADVDPLLRTMQTARRVIGAFMEGQDLADFPFRSNDILLFGNEANGVSEKLSALVTHKVSIPCLARNRACAESLNVSVAAAVIMYRFATSRT